MPHDVHVGAFLLGGEHATVEGCAHHHIAAGEELHGLGTGLPPLDARLDLVELLERALHAVRGGQHGIDLVLRHTIGQQGELQGVLGALAQGPLTGEFRNVPEVRPAAWRCRQLVGVVGHGHGPDQQAGAALGQRARQEVRAIEFEAVQALEHAALAAAQQLGAFDLHRVPAYAAGIDHGLDQAHLAVVLAGHDPVSAGVLEGFVESLGLHGLAHPAEGDHGQVGGHGSRSQGGSEHCGNCLFSHDYLCFE
ncbi:hypothetical protein D3C78_1042140 [compost metagenome]